MIPYGLIYSITPSAKLSPGRLILDSIWKYFPGFWLSQGLANGRLRQEIGGSMRGRLEYFFLAPFLLGMVSWALVVPSEDTFYDPSLLPLQHWGGGQLPTPVSLLSLVGSPNSSHISKSNSLTNYLFIWSIWA